MEILIAIGIIIIVVAVMKSMFKLAILAGVIFLVYYFVTTMMY